MIIAVGYGSREGQFSAPAKCGSLFRNLRNSSPQFAELFSAFFGTKPRGAIFHTRKMRMSVPQFAELFSAICGDRIPQFAEILFTKTGVSYLFQFVRVAIDFVPELHIMLMGV